MRVFSTRRGDIWMTDLGEDGIGSEQKGLRPCVVIQNNIGNHYGPTVIVAAITTAVKAKMPTHFVLKSSDGVYKTSVCLCEQVFTVDKRRLKSYVGRLGEDKFKVLNKCLSVSLGLTKGYDKIK